jgi:putative ABC transport system substrate-binding protein
LLRSRARWWGKRLELVKEAVPRAGRIAVLSHGDAGSRSMIQEAQKAAPSLGVKVIVVEVRNGDYDGAFARIAAERPDALFVLPTTFFFRDMKPIIALAAGHRLPAIYECREQVEEGGLMAYGSNLSGLGRRVAAYVDRIFKGRSRRICPWSSRLARADEVIQ